MKKTISIFISFLIPFSIFAQEQKIISDCTITYAVVSSTATDQKNIGSKLIYIKGKNLRVDLVSKTYSQTTLYSANGSSITVLKNVGESKYISEYNPAEWKKANEIYNGATVSLTNDTKDILTYKCKQAIIKLKNGNTYTVYYVPLLLPSVMESPFEVKNIPGLVLEYEAENQGKKIIYTAENVEFDPVPSLQFDIPKDGYRVLD